MANRFRWLSLFPADGDQVLLPIDSKFPREDYEHLQEAIAAGDSKLTAHYRRELDVLRTSALGTLIRLEIVPRASHLFLEPGALEVVINHAAARFERHLRPARSARARRVRREN